LWRDFDDLAHHSIALWRRCREGVGKNEAGGTVWRVDHPALRNYLDSGGPLVEGFERQDILDGVVMVNGVKNGG
jgi:hypothetical protein